MEEYPNDADGDALRRVVSLGSDMSLPMDIDFFVEVPDREAGERVAAVASLAGYRTELNYDDEDDVWTCYCTKYMLAEYDGVVASQRELDELCSPFGGYTDGWGTLGNADDGQSGPKRVL